MEHVSVVVLGLAGLLTIAVLILPLSRRLNFPYTVLLALVGILLGVVIHGVGDLEELGPLGEILHAFGSFDLSAEVILFVFLPALVFESALSIDVRRLLDDIAPILILAVIGLLISTFLVGASLWMVAGASFVVCLLVGAIVSATDPVAVVAIFKDLGAPKRLAILVEGESLFNDATAIVLYTILAAMVIGTASADVVGGTLSFLRVFVGGVIVGIVLARIFIAIIAPLRKAPLVEITLTITLAYLSFVVAEHFLHVSGVMATVTAALVMGATGRTAIAPDTWHLLEETWEQIGFWANSLIFVLVGIAVPVILQGVTAVDLTALVVLLIAAFIARALLIQGLVPAMSAAGVATHVNAGFRAVMLWGGLRGAVSLALALTVMENDAFSEEVQRFVGTLVCGFVLFTLFVQATTVRVVMSFFGLDKLSPVDLAIRNRALSNALTDVERNLSKTAEEQDLDETIAGELAGAYRERANAMRDELEHLEGLSDDDWRRVGLAAVIAQERHAYLDQYGDGVIGSQVARLLLAQTDDLADALKTGGVENCRDAADKSLAFGWRFRVALLLQRRFRWTGPLAERLADRFEIMRATVAALNEILDHGLDQIRGVVGERTTADLRDMIEDRRQKVQTRLEALRLQYPEYSQTLEERDLEQLAIRLEEARYEEMYGSAIINNDVLKSLQSDVDQRARELEERPPLDLGLKPEELVRKVPLFEGLGADRIAEITDMLKPELAIPGERIVAKGEIGDAMYFISSGAMEVDVKPEPVRLGSGDFFGELALLRDEPRNADVVATGFCDLLVLKARDFRTLLEENPEMRAEIERVASQRLAVD